jgi:nitrogen regulatory protein PII-like uncharacterized protein
MSERLELVVPREKKGKLLRFMAVLTELNILIENKERSKPDALCLEFFSGSEDLEVVMRDKSDNPVTITMSGKDNKVTLLHGRLKEHLDL